VFSRGEAELFKPLIDDLLARDEYLLFADFPAYLECQQRVSDAYEDRDDWLRKSILNVSRVGYFSSDRAVREYCELIWKAKPLKSTVEKE
jgi:starch phosphorylase